MPALSVSLRLRFWLNVMDLIAAMPGGYGSRPYYWAVTKASDATDRGSHRVGEANSTMKSKGSERDV